MKPYPHHSSSAKKLLLLFTLLCATITGALHGQIKGTILDKEHREPVSGASVYINNTTYGCKADAEGHFSLQSFPPPPFQLIISCVGYESVTLDISRSKDSNLVVMLPPKIQDLGEIVILSPQKDGWAKYGKAFMEDFIGYSTFADQCEILNKEVLDFRYDDKNIVLYVLAREPLQIRNMATGYLITYWLDDYEKEYKTRRLFFKGSVQFEALQPAKEKDQKRWEQNRLSAYNGSLNHFMASLYNNTVYEEGYELRIYKHVAALEYGRQIPFKTDVVTRPTDPLIARAITEYLNYPPEALPRFARAIENWSRAEDTVSSFQLKENVDSTEPTKHLQFCFDPEKPGRKWIQYYDHYYTPDATNNNLIVKDVTGKPMRMPRVTKETYVYLWKQKVPLDSFVVRNSDHQVRLKFNDYIQVTYNREKEERRYIDGQFGRPSKTAGLQQSLITLENPEGVKVFADGNFTEPYDLITVDYWSYEKIDKILPLNYKE